MEYFTVLLPSENKGDETTTFQAEGMEDAIEKVKQEYPNRTYRLFRGKEVPKKQVENLKIPPTKVKK